jgi:hypothetical protein
MNHQLDHKINESFPGVVVRKDLVKQVKGNAIVPSYVLEYLLGQYCATRTRPASSRASRRSRRSCAPTTSIAARRGWFAPPSASAAGTRSSTRSASISTTAATPMRPPSPTWASRKCSSIPTRSSATPSCWSAASGPSPTWSMSSIRGGNDSALDPQLSQADPAITLRFRPVSRSAPRLFHGRVDRPAAPEYGLQPGVVRPAGQADSSLSG